MTLMPLAQLVQAAKNAQLVAMHTHDGWIKKDTTSCPRCQAEAALLTAARVFLLAQPPSP